MLYTVLVLAGSH